MRIQQLHTLRLRGKKTSLYTPNFDFDLVRPPVTLAAIDPKPHAAAFLAAMDRAETNHAKDFV